MGNEFIGTDYDCPSYPLCEGSWKIDNQEKWDEISSGTRNNIPFSTPLAPYIGLSYQKGGLMLVSINFNFSGDDWDARKGPVDTNSHRLDKNWRRGSLFSNAEKLINSIFSISGGTDYADQVYAFANIVKCSPHNHLSQRSYPSRTQFHQCIYEREHIQNEIELLDPGLILCIGYDAFEHLLTKNIQKRLPLGQRARITGTIARIDADTIIVGVPHLSGGMRAINIKNKAYKAGNKNAAEGYPVLRGRSYEEAMNYLEQNGIKKWFGDNIVLPAMAYEIKDFLIRTEPRLYERIRGQLQSHVRPKPTPA